MKLSTIVPCYNEPKNIRLTLEHVAAVLTQDGIEVLLVNYESNNNSAKHREQASQVSIRRCCPFFYQ